MTKRFCITAGVVVVGILSLVILAWKMKPDPEPVYQGKRLSQWMERHVPTSSAYGSAGWKEADEALRQIGTNGIPTLLRMLRAKNPSPLMRKILGVAQKQRWIPIHYRYGSSQNEEAEYAFQVLGRTASNAVPALIKIYRDAVSPSSHAALALGHIGSAARPAIPALLRNFSHTNEDVRFYAVSAVYYIGGDPEVLVPALVGVLKDMKKEVRWNAVVALSTFGDKARSAVPALLEALADQPIKEQVEIALWRIAPEKVGRPLVVEEATPMIADGVTTEAVDVKYKNERRTLIKAGRVVPCGTQFWNSGPLDPLALFRKANTPAAKDTFLGEYQVIGIPPAPANSIVNVSLLCVIADGKIVICARDNNASTNAFLEIRRMDR